MSVISLDAQKQLFLDARTYNGWQEKPVARETLSALYDLMKWGPTSTNTSPLRIVFLTTPEAKEKLRPALMSANVEKTMTAPVTAILARDLKFYEKLPVLSPANNAVSWFPPDAPNTRETAVRNATLQGGYFILAARAVGLDCGPMSGFDTAAVNAAFFAGTSLEVDFLCNLGYGDPTKTYPRGPRLAFDEACSVV